MDQEAQPIGPVVVPGIIDLDVAPQHVQAVCLGQGNVPANVVVGRIGIQAVRMECLVQGAAQVHRFMIEKQVLLRVVPPYGPAKLAHAKIGGNFIGPGIVIRAQPDKGIVEKGMIR